MARAPKERREKNFSLSSTEEEAACSQNSRKRKFAELEEKECLRNQLSDLENLHKQYEEKEKTRALEALEKAKRALTDQAAEVCDADDTEEMEY